MKKLIWLMVLGVIFFIGGQWWGLSLSETKNQSEVAPTEEFNQPDNITPDAQNGSASESKK